MEELEQKMIKMFVYYGIALFIVFLIAYGHSKDTRLNAIVSNYESEKEELQGELFLLQEQIDETQISVEELEYELCKYKNYEWCYKYE